MGALNKIFQTNISKNGFTPEKILIFLLQVMVILDKNLLLSRTFSKRHALLL